MEAAGLASSMISFIDFSYKLILGTVDVHKKATTGPAADPHISNIINDLEDVTRNMTTLSTGPSAKSPATAQNPSALQDSSHHEALRKLAVGCNDLSKSLVDVLKNLERKPGAISSGAACKHLGLPCEVPKRSSKWSKSSIPIVFNCSFV
jgi:hypothetical protein